MEERPGASGAGGEGRGGAVGGGDGPGAGRRGLAPSSAQQGGRLGHPPLRRPPTSTPLAADLLVHPTHVPAETNKHPPLSLTHPRTHVYTHPTHQPLSLSYTHTHASTNTNTHTHPPD